MKFFLYAYLSVTCRALLSETLSPSSVLFVAFLLSLKFYHDISTGNFVSGEFCFALASLVVTILYAFIGRKSFFYSSRCVSCQCPCELCSCISFRRQFPISKVFHSSISLSPRCITITSVQNVFMLRSC